MSETAKSLESQLLVVQDGDESRRVSAVLGASLAVMEVSRGPATELAFGSAVHGHKILCAYDACARVLGVSAAALLGALTCFFAGARGCHPLLSDLMDRFDAAGERYTYTAWGGDGNAVFRPAERA